MLSPANDLVTKLDVDGAVEIGTTTGWAVFVGHMPESSAQVPETAVLLQDIPGNDPNPKLAIDDDSVLVVVRGEVRGETAAYAKAYEIRNILLGMDKETIAGSEYIGVWCDADVEYLGKNENEQTLLGLGLRVMRQPVDLGNRMGT